MFLMELLRNLPPSQTFKLAKLQTAFIMPSTIWGLGWFSSLLDLQVLSLCRYIKYTHIENGAQSLMHPGGRCTPWHLAGGSWPDLTTILTPFLFPSLSMGKRPKELVRSSAEKGWGAFCEKHEVRNPAILGICVERQLVSVLLSQNGTLTSTLLSDGWSSSSSSVPGGRSATPQKVISPVAVPTLQHLVMPQAWVLKP